LQSRSLGLARQAEADDMRREIDARRLEFGTERTRIRVAALGAVGDEDDRGLDFPVAQLLGGESHGCRQRCHALERKGVHLLADRRAVGADRHQLFDVAAVAGTAVPVSDQTQAAIGRDLVQEIADDGACDCGLGLPLDLAPHRTGRVEHQDRVVRPGDTEKRWQQSECQKPVPHVAPLHR